MNKIITVANIYEVEQLQECLEKLSHQRYNNLNSIIETVTLSEILYKMKFE